MGEVRVLGVGDKRALALMGLVLEMDVVEYTPWVVTTGAYDLGMSVRNGEIIREPALSGPRLGWMNLHLGRLPEYRGVRPIGYGLLAGEKSLTVTWHRVEAGVDTGAIVSETVVEVGAGDDAVSMYDKMMAEAVNSLFVLVQGGLEERIQAARPQGAGGSYHSRGDWAREEARYERMKRAMAWR